MVDGEKIRLAFFRGIENMAGYGAARVAERHIVNDQKLSWDKFLDEPSQFEFSIPDIEIKRNDNSQVRDKIMSIDPDKRKELKINKSTLWYQQAVGQNCCLP
jgi:NADPH-dependent curcumin reductase CurA